MVGFTGFDSSLFPPDPTTKLIILFASDALRFFPPPVSDPPLSGVTSRLRPGVISRLRPGDGEGVARLGMLNLVSPPQSGERGFSILKLWETLDLVGVVTAEDPC